MLWPRSFKPQVCQLTSTGPSEKPSPVLVPSGEWSGAPSAASRAIDRRGRAFGPAFGRRRRRRQSQPDLVATQGGTAWRRSMGCRLPSPAATRPWPTTRWVPPSVAFEWPGGHLHNRPARSKRSVDRLALPTADALHRTRASNKVDEPRLTYARDLSKPEILT